MRVIDPSVYSKKSRPRKKRRLPWKIVSLLAIFLVGSYGFLAATVEADYTVTNVYPQQLDANDISITWPASGAAAIGYVGASSTVLASHNGNTKLPSASTIKILTALMVLNRKPLNSGEAGESITFTAGDVERTNAISSEGGVYFPITEGMSLTYRQALDALLISSSNNIAEKLATWAYGSIDEYKAATQIYLNAVGIVDTTVDEPSGLSSATVTTAEDLLSISLRALEVPILREIIATASKDINGTLITNTNQLLGNGGVNGIKTGYTLEAGNCLLLSKTVKIENDDVTFVAVVMGQQDRAGTFTAANQLLSVLSDNTAKATVASTDKTVADVSAPWGVSTPVRVEKEIAVHKWAGEVRTADIRVVSQIDASAKKGAKVGTLSLAERSADLILAEDLPQPNLWWRLTHALDAIGEII